ncbi:MAG: C4-dicarboxylate ABC transporter [Gammaproteobacteria bacterium]
MSLTIDRVETEGWKLQGIELALSDLTGHPQRLTLSIKRMNLPEPFDQIDFVNVNCLDFSWGNEEMICNRGDAEIHNPFLQTPHVRFSFHIRQHRSEFHVGQVKLGGGELTFDGEATGRRWRLKGAAGSIDVGVFQRFLPPDYETSQGRISADFDVEGTVSGLDKMVVTMILDKLSGQAKDGRKAAEDAVLAASLRAQRERGLWRWLSRVEFRNGALYFEPLFLEAVPEAIALNTAGVWDVHSQRAEIGYLHYQHPGAGEVTGHGTVGFSGEILLERAKLTLSTTDLKTLSTTYVTPFLLGSAMEGLVLEGKLTADIAVIQQSLTECTLDFVPIDVSDAKGRFSLKGGTGAIHWSSDEDFSKPSAIAWRQLQIYNLPFGPSKFSFLARAKSVELLEKTRLPFLDGYLTVDQFNWQARAQTDPDVYFVGAVEQVSLEQLSEALNWTPLSGSISGRIPGVDYRDKKLTLSGELLIDVFDGEIRIKDLASSGLFSDFPQLSANISVNNLDLDQLTRKFKFGGIEGRLSGFVHDLYLENWRAVSFYAWLGTPTHDDSRHKISQKAVENLASIGGGGATDLVSRTLLRFFDTFGYDRLGLGCYLHQGVCQLMGVEPAPQGFYIVKGGGLPRIDVIGYNPRIDWNVLLQRLSRITTTDEAVIE